MNKKRVFKFIVSIILPFIAGGIGSLFTQTTVDTWYLELVKPSFQPPGWVFGPVWNLLFLLMGISLFLVWDKGLKSKTSKIGITFFGVQLGLNSLWSILFFGLKSPLLSLIEIFVLWVAILGTIIYFFKIRKSAGYLLLPYILWVSFAAILNFAIVLLN